MMSSCSNEKLCTNLAATAADTAAGRCSPQQQDRNANADRIAVPDRSDAGCPLSPHHRRPELHQLPQLTAARFVS